MWFCLKMKYQFHHYQLICEWKTVHKMMLDTYLSFFVICKFIIYVVTLTVCIIYFLYYEIFVHIARCEWISNSILQHPNSEQDIDVFVKSHIFSCLHGTTDQHL